ncbi:alpha/beta hydrolase [Ectothiorhodospiraceae bacterium WFHF3C12]|nr:alpha/beta hydrolase [Ectothiorhodospiraceae bacterium WFHF3C12]
METVRPTVAGVTHRFVTVGGLTMHYAEAGEGEPLILLHGWPQHWYLWRAQIPALARHYRVICPDLRGFGWTDAPRGPYDKERLAADVLELCDALGIERFRLAGHDWGGWVGFLMCLRRPERVTRFLALNITHPFGSPAGTPVRALLRFWYQAVIAAPLLGYLLLRFTPFVRRLLVAAARDRVWEREALAAYSGRLRQHARAAASVRLYRTFLLRELPAVVRGRYRQRRLTTETLLLFGTGDIAIDPALLDGYRDHADRMTVEWIDGAGHFIVEDRPELVTERAVAFFGHGLTSPGLD